MGVAELVLQRAGFVDDQGNEQDSPMAACKIYVLIPPKQMTQDVERNLSVEIDIFRRADTYATAFGWVGVLIGLAIMPKHAMPYNFSMRRTARTPTGQSPP